MKRALVTPLFWGLGHATRCIPLVQCLLESGFEVIIASDGQALALLKLEFPALTAYELPGYNVSYKSENMLWNTILLAPGILKAIKKEKSVIDQIVLEQKVDVVISDNRYGCYSKFCKNIIITHQINIQTGNRLSDWIAQKVNLLLLSKFQSLWVPDVENNVNLSGVLSHGIEDLKIPTKYIGIISRLKNQVSAPGKFVLIVLSGPEPQRSLFEKIVVEQLNDVDYPVVFVKGVVNGNMEVKQDGKTIFYNFVDSLLLSELLQDAIVVVSRCGYTTLMDLVVTGKKALLIPTPGQTEQIYLAKHLEHQGIFSFQTQKNFNLKKGIKQALSKKSTNISANNSLKISISALLKELNSK